MLAAPALSLILWQAPSTLHYTSPLHPYSLTSFFPTDVFISDNSAPMQSAPDVPVSRYKLIEGSQRPSIPLLVFACVPPASNTVDYWRPLIAVLSCCPHSCYLADSFIVYMQMEVGYWTTKTLAPNGKQTIGVACGEKVRSIELINTRKGTHYGHCDLYFPPVPSSTTVFRWKLCDMSQ